MLSENEALKEYCKSFYYEKSNLTDDEIKEVMECDRQSLGFQKYLLYLAIKDVKQSMFDELPLWLQGFLRSDNV